LDLKGPTHFLEDIFMRKGQTKISAEDILRKKTNRLSNAEKEKLEVIKMEYLGREKKVVQHEEIEEDSKIEEVDVKQKNQWWIKKTDL